MLQGLGQLKFPCQIAITTDSKYVMDGVTKWLPNWLQRDWRTAEGKPVKNQDLWQQMIPLLEKHHVTWHWVEGHSGHPENERADQLANKGIDDLLESQE